MSHDGFPFDEPEDEHEVDSDDFLTKQDMRDMIDDVAEELDIERAKSAQLKKQNEQMTMDLILIATMLGVQPNMNLVTTRISELLEQERRLVGLDE